MTEKTKPARRSLATFLQGPATPAPTAAPESAADTLAAADAQATLTLDLPSPVVSSEAAPASEEAPTAVSLEAASAADSASSVEVIEDAASAEDEAAPTVAAPSFARASARPTAVPTDTPRWQWGVVLALALLLGLQIILSDRARLAADAGTRPLVSALCTVLRCTLPPWHEPSAFSMLSRDIRPVPGQAGALQVQASFRNDARWAQAWPALRLSLSDADGRVIGRRTLQAAEYLGPGADPQARLEPGQSAQVSFRLREPAAATVAFSFEFQ